MTLRSSCAGTKIDSDASIRSKPGNWIRPLRDADVELVTVDQGMIDWNDFAGPMLYGIKQEGKHAYFAGSQSKRASWPIGSSQMRRMDQRTTADGVRCSTETTLQVAPGLLVISGQSRKLSPSFSQSRRDQPEDRGQSPKKKTGLLTRHPHRSVCHNSQPTGRLSIRHTREGKQRHRQAKVTR